MTLPALQPETQTSPVTVADCRKFLRAHGRRVAAAWPEDCVDAWLAYHARHGNLVVIRGEDGAITALGIGWQCRRAWIDEQDQSSRALWFPGDHTGECFYFAQVVVADPAAVDALVREWRRRWPSADHLRLYAHRRKPSQAAHEPGRLVRVSFKTVFRLAARIGASRAVNE